MSQLIDKLKQVSQAAPQPMGFGRAQPSLPRQNMILVASLSPANVDRVADYTAGCDVALWHVPARSKIRALLEKSQAVPDIPWGCWLADDSAEELAVLAEADLDFVIFPATTPLGTLQDSKAGRILQVTASLTEGLLRTINDLPIDAVLLVGEPEREPLITWHHLMLCQRFASILDKPLLVTLPPKVTAKELQALLEAGVNGVIVEAEAGETARLRQQIDKLSPPRRKRGPAEALLPRIVPEPEPVAEDEEEEP